MRINNLTFLLLVILAPAVLADDSAPPQKKVSLSELLNSTTGYSSQSPSVAGVRGLEEPDAPVDTKARDYAAIDKLDHLAIHEDDVKKFVDEGKVQ